MDPFFCECRAYGRLIERGLNGIVAVRCHCYVAIPAKREEELRVNFGVDHWDRPPTEYAKASHRRQPFRAIIKDLVTEHVPFTEQTVKKILNDLKRMRRVGVYPMDVQARNYIGGLLVDFSVAMTVPHYLFEIKPRWLVEKYKREDLQSWQALVEEEGIVTEERAVPNFEYCKKLRSYRGSDQESDD